MNVLRYSFTIQWSIDKIAAIQDIQNFNVIGYHRLLKWHFIEIRYRGFFFGSI